MLEQPITAPARASPPAVAAWVLTALIVGLSIWQQARLGLNTDVSWLIVVNDRMLGGARLYRDIFEVNPPASVWLYTGQVALARATGLHAEALVAASVYGLTAAALWAIHRIAPQHPPRLPLAALVLLLLPGAAFAQREHYALLFLLPWLALMLARARGAPVPLSLTIIAGIGAGLAMAVKPPFAAAPGLPLLWAAWQARSWRTLFGPEVAAAVAVVAAYAASILLFQRAYLTEALPMLGAGYFSVRAPVASLVADPYMIATLLIAAIAWLAGREGRARAPIAVLLLAAAGFVVAMLVQGKYYLNHPLPAAQLAVLAAASAVTSASGEGRRVGAVALALLTAALAFLATQVTGYPALTALVRAQGIARPALLVAASNLSVGHPLTRQVGGEWSGTRGALWATGTAADLLSRTADPARRRQLEAIIAEDRALFVADLARAKPDLVIVDAINGPAWIAAHPEVAAALRPYAPAGHAEGQLLLRRVSEAGRWPRAASAR